MPLQRRDRIVLAVESTRTIYNDATTFELDPYTIIGGGGQTRSYAAKTLTFPFRTIRMTEHHPTATIDLPNPTGTLYV